MNEDTIKIRKLISQNGKNAADMTHIISEIGGGDMQTGLKKFANFFYDDGNEYGLRIGKISGMIQGSAITLTAVSVYLFTISAIQKRNENYANKVRRAKMEALIKNITTSDIDQTVSDYKETDNEIN